MEIGKQILAKMKVHVLLEKKHNKISHFLRYKDEYLFLSLILSFIFSFGLNFALKYRIFPILPLDMILLISFPLCCFIAVAMISANLDKKMEKLIESISDSEVLVLLSPLEIKKYQIKSGDFVHYINGFKFTESGVKFSVEKLSPDGDCLLLKDPSGNYKEVSIKDFLSSQYQ